MRQHDFLRRALLALVLSASFGCKSLMFWKKGDASDEVVNEDEETKAGVRPKNASLDELELKLAKTWARVDELEEEQFRLKDKLRVLEKGLVLGLVPEELQTNTSSTKDSAKKNGDVEPEAEKNPSEKLITEAGDSKAAKSGKGATLGTPEPLSPDDQEALQKALASAQDQYRAGKYGRAIVEFSDLDKLYGQHVEGGLHQYWIAKSWVGLKEYNTARQHLQEFIKNHPTSPWVPRAKLDLAKVEWKLGLQETAIQHFRDIIQAHPYEDAAEMAKMELSNLDKSL